MNKVLLNEKEQKLKLDDLSTNKAIYRLVLKSSKHIYPSDFWNKDVEIKSKELLRAYLDWNSIRTENLHYRDIESLVEDAKLKEPIEKEFLGNTYLFLEETISSIDLTDLRWNISPTPTTTEIRRLRENYYCTWKSISNYYNKDSREFRRKYNFEPPEKVIDAPVLEVLKFWLNVRRAKEERISLEEVISRMEKYWDEERTNRYLNQFDIKKECKRYNSQRKTAKEVEQTNSRLYSTEKLFLKHQGQKILKLRGYGADFLDPKNNEIIEVKKKLSTINISHAIIQLNYGEKHLEAGEKAIYTRKVDLKDKETSEYKKYLKFHDIKIYEFNQDKESFEQIPINKL